MFISKRPYFLRAWYDWMTANKLTPYITVDAKLPQVTVPQAYVKQGTITLNISPQAVNNFQIALDRVEFEAGFGEVATIERIYAPIQAIQAIYALENGQGAFFAHEAGEVFPTSEIQENHKKPQLTIIE